MPDQQLVTVNEASRITGLSTSTLYRLSRRGGLRSFKVLRTLRFDKADLNRLIVERPAAQTK